MAFTIDHTREIAAPPALVWQALTDFAATDLAIGNGLDPATAPGISDLHLPRKAPE